MGQELPGQARQGPQEGVNSSQYPLVHIRGTLGPAATLRILLREAVRETVAEVLQTVLELDRTAFLQVHGGRRNGYYPRKLETTFGQVDLKVPRDRESRYYPAFLKPYARRLVDVGK